MEFIKLLKNGNSISGVEPTSINDKGEETWNIPQDLSQFKLLAIDTINWKHGRGVVGAIGNIVNLSTAISKGLALLAKLSTPTKAKLDALTDTERASYEILAELGESNYADSELLLGTLRLVNGIRGSDTTDRVMSATTHDEVIKILNED